MTAQKTPARETRIKTDAIYSWNYICERTRYIVYFCDEFSITLVHLPKSNHSSKVNK